MEKIKVTQLHSVMTKYYDNIKDKLEVAKAFESSETDEESRSAVKMLRPKNILKVKEMLSVEHS